MLLSETSEAPGGMLWAELKSHEQAKLLHSDYLLDVILT